VSWNETGIPILLAGGFQAYPDGSKMDVVKISDPRWDGSIKLTLLRRAERKGGTDMRG
jgi:hypothetical protein